MAKQSYLSYYQLFEQQLSMNDTENARGILRAFTSLFEVERFLKSEHQTSLVRTLNKFLANEEFYKLEIFRKFPFRAAGDVMKALRCMDKRGDRMSYSRAHDDDPISKNDPLLLEFERMLGILNKNQDLITPSDAARIRLASRGIKIDKQLDSVFDVLGTQLLEDFVVNRFSEEIELSSELKIDFLPLVKQE